MYASPLQDALTVAENLIYANIFKINCFLFMEVSLMIFFQSLF